jgi:hypothetical protein
MKGTFDLLEEFACVVQAESRLWPGWGWGVR